MRVPCSVEFKELEGRNGPLDGVVVSCNRCEKQVESFGQTDASVKRCFILLREQCDEENYYYVEDES